jgi:two-component sensor histidine kinase
MSDSPSSSFQEQLTPLGSGAAEPRLLADGGQTAGRNLMTATLIRALLVEDNPGDARLLRESVIEVAAPQLAWTHVERLAEALHQLDEASFDVMLLDLSLPDTQGFDTFARAHAHHPDLPVVVLTGLDDEAMAIRTVQEGAQDYLVKGRIDGAALVRSLRYAIERCRVLRALQESERRFREMAEQLRLSVREAHHRIKNNLQAISDLLYLELTASTISPEDALRGSIERIQAIATVHDLLSQDEDVRVVDARAVLERLAPIVLRSNGKGARSIAVKLEAQPVSLSAKRATVLALIVNELVSNAVKHAYKEGKAGELALSLRQESEELVLRVRDHGPGLPPGFSLSTHSHVGLDVVRTLAERDLDGCFTLSSQDGVLAEVRFMW